MDPQHTAVNFVENTRLMKRILPRNVSKNIVPCELLEKGELGELQYNAVHFYSCNDEYCNYDDRVMRECFESTPHFYLQHLRNTIFRVCVSH